MMDFLQRVLFRLRFTLHPLSPVAHDLMMRIGRGEVRHVEELSEPELQALIELARRGLVRVYEPYKNGQ